MERRIKTNPLQWSMLLDFAEKHPEIITRKFTSVGSKYNYNELWKEISSHLNSMGFQQKTVEKWQKAIADWKSKVKAKAAEINRGLTQTGGGGPMPPLNENEQRLLAILGWTSVKGHNVSELGINENKSATREAVPDENMEQVVDGAQLKFDLPSSSPSSPPPLVTIQKAAPPEPAVSLFPPGPLPIPLSSNAAPQELVPLPSQTDERAPKKRKIKRPKTVTQPVQKTEIQIFQEQTLSVLNSINCNLSRVADAQEKMCSLLENMKQS